MISLNDRLKQCRKDARLSQIEFAEKLAVHPNTLRKWESGERSPNAAKLADIAAKTGVSMAWLLGLDQVKNGTVSETPEKIVYVQNYDDKFKDVYYDDNNNNNIDNNKDNIIKNIDISDVLNGVNVVNAMGDENILNNVNNVNNVNGNDKFKSVENEKDDKVIDITLAPDAVNVSASSNLEGTNLKSKQASKPYAAAIMALAWAAFPSIFAPGLIREMGKMGFVSAVTEAANTFADKILV